MNEPRHAGITGDLGDQFGAPATVLARSERDAGGLDSLDVHGFVGKVSRLPVPGSEVVHDVRVPYAFLDLLGVSNVPFLRGGVSKSRLLGIATRKQRSKTRRRASCMVSAASPE